ncbi:MAG: MFS transporter, partial [Alistipes sp.]|nr:MFS transporter [Alistipes sp.]
ALVIGLGNGHLFPAFQTMFLNLGTNDQRGTANSTFLVSWDIGIGIGIIVGGSIAEHLGYHTAFWVAAIANGIAVATYFLHTHGYFERNRLR